MNRRSLLGSLFAFVAGLFVGKPATAKPVVRARDVARKTWLCQLSNNDYINISKVLFVSAVPMPGENWQESGRREFARRAKFYFHLFHDTYINIDLISGIRFEYATDNDHFQFQDQGGAELKATIGFGYCGERCFYGKTAEAIEQWLIDGTQGRGNQCWALLDRAPKVLETLQGQELQDYLQRKGKWA